jgi:NADH dehydrogenase FAD-containing subunit
MIKKALFFCVGAAAALQEWAEEVAKKGEERVKESKFLSTLFEAKERVCKKFFKGLRLATAQQVEELEQKVEELLQKKE